MCVVSAQFIIHHFTVKSYIYNSDWMQEMGQEENSGGEKIKLFKSVGAISQSTNLNVSDF